MLCPATQRRRITGVDTATGRRAAAVGGTEVPDPLTVIAVELLAAAGIAAAVRWSTSGTGIVGRGYQRRQLHAAPHSPLAAVRIANGNRIATTSPAATRPMRARRHRRSIPVRMYPSLATAKIKAASPSARLAA